MSRLARSAETRHDELTMLRAVVAEAARVAAAAAAGDSEARMVAIPGTEDQRDALALRASVNALLDRTDSFTREVTGALGAMSDGRFYREVLPVGMLGAFRQGATAINDARTAMLAAEARTAQSEARRRELADRLEVTVLGIAHQVAAASTQLGATAATLAASAGRAVGQADDAATTVSRLEVASTQIREVVALISSVAAQTKLLALNAQIEAARAGAAGRGFEVVAAEVKSLADTTAKSTEDITTTVSDMLAVTGQSVHAMESVGGTLRDIAPMVADLRLAVEGDGLLRGDERDGQGLAQMAETLRAEMDEFISVMRAG
jgi:methyl-accepting chemotaxis protein